MKNSSSSAQQVVNAVRPRSTLVAQCFDEESGQIIFQVKNNRSEHVFEVAAKTLFNNNRWLTRFSLENIRQIAFAAVESVLAMEQRAIANVRKAC